MMLPRLTINGGGIGGLATALALHSRNLVPNLHINILEKNADPDAWVGRGAGLNLQPHAVKFLNEIGLMEEVVASGWAPMSQQYFTKNGKLIANSPRGLHENPNGYPQISIHRGALHGILERAVEERLGSETIIRGQGGVSYTQDDSCVYLECTDPEGNHFEVHTDAVIGADGIHSSMRQAMQLSRGRFEGGPLFSGINVYRGTAMVDKVLDGHTVILAGRSDAKLVAYPLAAPKRVENEDGSVGQKQLYNFVVELAEESSPYADFANQDQLADYVATKLEDLNGGGFSLPFLNHRKMLREADSLKAFPMSDRDPLDTWCDGKVVLLGDAAHPMYPVGSNGASSVLLDAREIASTIARKISDNSCLTTDKLCQAFDEYEAARHPAVMSVQTACRKMLPEQVMDRVQNEVCEDEPVPKAYEKSLLQALAICQAGGSKTVAGQQKKAGRDTKPYILSIPALRTPAPCGSNTQLLANCSPIERLLLTANGSLQRTISAVTNSAVIVNPVMTATRNNCFLDREVTLHLKSVDGPCVATCKTTVVSHDDKIKARMLSQEIGIGQLLTDPLVTGSKEPLFKLIAFGKGRDNVLTRQYSLNIPDTVNFLIHEDIDLGVLFSNAPWWG